MARWPSSTARSPRESTCDQRVARRVARVGAHHLVGERVTVGRRRRPRPASISSLEHRRAHRRRRGWPGSRARPRSCTMRALGNAGLQWPSSSTTAVSPMPSRWDRATTSTVSGGKPAAVIAESTASWWPIASGPERMNGSAAPQGSTTMTTPSDSITQMAWPTSTSPSRRRPVRHRPARSWPTTCSGVSAGDRRVERDVEVRHPRHRHRTDLEPRHARPSRKCRRLPRRRRASRVRARAGSACSGSSGSGEAQLVAVGVADVEVALAPRRVGRLGHGLQPGAATTSACTASTSSTQKITRPQTVAAAVPVRVELQVHEARSGPVAS